MKLSHFRFRSRCWFPRMELFWRPILYYGTTFLICFLSILSAAAEYTLNWVHMLMYTHVLRYVHIFSLTNGFTSTSKLWFVSWRRNSICRLHRSGCKVTSYAYFEEKENHRNRSRSDCGLDFGFLHRKHVITDGSRAGMQVVPSRQHNGQHLVWNHMHYKSCVVMAGKPHVHSTQGTKWEWWHMDHDRNKVRSNQKTNIDHAFWR